MNAKRKTVSQQRAKTAERAPVVKLVEPDDSEHPKATDEQCGARAIHKGVHVECERAALHEGDHDYNGLSWRRRSGETP